jgi:hypothetical protein
MDYGDFTYRKGHAAAGGAARSRVLVLLMPSVFHCYLRQFSELSAWPADAIGEAARAYSIVAKTPFRCDFSVNFGDNGA